MGNQQSAVYAENEDRKICQNLIVDWIKERTLDDYLEAGRFPANPFGPTASRENVTYTVSATSTGSDLDVYNCLVRHRNMNSPNNAPLMGYLGNREFKWTSWFDRPDSEKYTGYIHVATPNK